jgi:hypothetical protein
MPQLNDWIAARNCDLKIRQMTHQVGAALGSTGLSPSADLNNLYLPNRGQPGRVIE